MLTISKNKRLVIFLLSIATILCVPLVAMLFTADVDWSILDFGVAGSLLVGTALCIEYILRRVKNANHRIILAMFILLLLILVWIELAVGIFGSPIAGS